MIREKENSYIVSGKSSVDLPYAVNRFGERFRIRTLLLKVAQRRKFSKLQFTTNLIEVFSLAMPWERSIGKASASKLKIYAKKDGRIRCFLVRSGR
jgi:hypothetical protein